MRDDDKVVSGFKNKIMVGMCNIMSESAVVAQMDKMQRPRDEDNNK